ncbi:MULTISPECIES: hypothetical protein [unclassified Geodermatophilus]|uniref:hypothetical protein n=1 Tax=unclassified Geodermatophilus TaxID=2637632 RepID=UPI003EF06E4C
MTGARVAWVATAAAALALGGVAVRLVAASALPVTTLVLLGLLGGGIWTGLHCVATVARSDPDQDESSHCAWLRCLHTGAPGSLG